MVRTGSEPMLGVVVEGSPDVTPTSTPRESVLPPDGSAASLDPRASAASVYSRKSKGIVRSGKGGQGQAVMSEIRCVGHATRAASSPLRCP